MPSLSEAANNRAETSRQLPPEEVAFVGEKVTFFALVAKATGRLRDDDWDQPPNIGLATYNPAGQAPPPVGLNYIGPIYTAGP